MNFVLNLTVYVLSRFYLRKRIHNPVCVTRSSWKHKVMFFLKIISMPILLCLLIHSINSKLDHEATESKLHLNDRCFEYLISGVSVTSGSFSVHYLKFICTYVLMVF